MATKKSKPSKGNEEAKNTKEELGYDPDKGFGKVMFFFKKNPMALVVVLLVIAALLGLMFYNNHQKKAAEDAHLQEVIANEKEALKSQQQQSDITKGTDMQLVQNQESLVQAFGKTPKGYIRNWDGSLLSLGDNNMTSDQVLYSYLKGISTLDMATVQKYSRNSSVYKTYSGYFDQGTAVSTDNSKEFEKELYRQAMLSVQTDKIVSTSVFTDNKVAYTVRLKMLDYSDKDFLDDPEVQKSLYDTMRKYSDAQNDSEKMKQYLREWLENYYTSGKAKLTEQTVDVTLEKYPDLNTGWLVSIDAPLDNDFKYSEGNPVFQYIQDNYYSWLTDTATQESE